MLPWFSRTSDGHPGIKPLLERLPDLVTQHTYPAKNHHPHELSGGEKQRVGIARSLANDPEVILADEPTGDLDSAIGREIMDLIESLNRSHGKTIVCVSHDENMLKPGMRLIKMEDGHIISDSYL